MVKLALAMLGAALLAGYTTAGDLRYEVRVAPIDAVVPGSIERSIYWIDNDSILYQGVGQKGSQAALQRAVVITWNTRTGAVNRIGTAYPPHSRFCYWEGFLSFATDRQDRELVLREGALGELVERRVLEEELSHDAARKRGEVPTRFGCSNRKLAELGPRGRYLVPLRAGDGFLDLTGGGSSEAVQRRRKEILTLPPDDAARATLQLERELAARPAVYLPSPNGPEIPLPIKSGELATFRPGYLYYSQWSDEYIFPADYTVPQQSEWPKGVPHPIYILKRNGSVMRVDMPYTASNLGRISAAVNTRAGMMITTHSIGRNGEVGEAGLYRLTDAKMELVLRGYLKAIAVSPDGCGIAVISTNLKTLVSKVHSVNACRER